MSVRRFRIALTIALAATLAWLGGAPPAMGQDNQSRSDELLDLSFEGGTVQQYVNMIEMKAGHANVILDLNDIEIPMPKVELKRVEFLSAMKLLDGRESIVNGMYVRLNMRTIQTTVREAPTVMITAEIEPAESIQNFRSTVLSVKDLLRAGMTAEDVLTAVTTALELFDESNEPAELRFHEQTGLLIARGDREQMATIHDVVDQLRKAAMQDRHSQEDQRRAAQLHEKLQHLQQELETRRHEMEAFARKAAENRTRAELLARELEQARAALETRTNHSMELATQIERLKMEMVQLRQQLEEARRKP